jgi:hypothetical protein
VYQNAPRSSSQKIIAGDSVHIRLDTDALRYRLTNIGAPGGHSARMASRIPS